MEKAEASQKIIKIGELGYVNKNCWLARNLGYPPSKRCQYCNSKFKDCLFERYLVITLILVSLLLTTSYLIEQSISKLLIVSIFILVIAYGYFFNKSTEKLIISNFEEGKAKNALKDLSDNLKYKVEEQTSELRNQKEKVEKALAVEKQAHELEKHANEELKHLDENKTDFMLITQHHLRTPLSVNNGFIDLMLSGIFGKIPTKIKDVILRLSESTQKEIDVVNELLDVSSYQIGKDMIHLDHSIDFEALMNETLKDLTAEAESKGIYLKYEKRGEIPKVPADRMKLKLVLTNVIDNCIKYTAKGGVTVAMEVKNDKLLISVADTGIGLSDEVIQNLFKQSFHRGEQAKKLFAVGKGLGLYLSGKIIEGHHGRIWAESLGDGKGSGFYIELPVKQEINQSIKIENNTNINNK